MPTRRLSTPTILITLMALVLAACSPARQAISMEEPSSLPAQPELFVESERGLAGAGDFAAPAADEGLQAEDRLVIRNANLTVIVDDPGESLNTIARMAEEMGGFVVSSNLYQTQTESGAQVPRASITVRVPAESLNEALSRIEADAVRVESRNESGQDVTQEYTDLQSRLRNLEDAEEQLRQIMDEARRTEDVIAVFNQLTSVRSEIEVIKGRIQFFEQSAAFSAISVELIANAAVQPLSIGGWQPQGVARAALQALIGGLQVLVNVLIWLVLFVGPLAVLVLIPLALLWRGFRRWRARRKSRSLEAPTPAEPSNG